MPAYTPLVRNRLTLLAALALLAMAACWGSTFFLIHDLLQRVPVSDFLALRFALASAALLALAPRAIVQLNPRTRKNAVVLGGLYGLAQVLQTAGLIDTAASVSGFITGFYVVATPLFAAFLLRSTITTASWAAAILAISGIAVLTLGDLGGLALSASEAVTFASALAYALHIVGLGAWSRPSDAIGMAVVQCLTVTAICTLAALPGGIDTPDRASDWLAVGYMAIFAGAAALLGQTWAQGHLNPTRAAIIMSMEPVFAALFAVLLGGESVTWRMVAGGSMVLGAMLMVEVLPAKDKSREKLPA